MVVGVMKSRSSTNSKLVHSVTFLNHWKPILCNTRLCFAFRNAALFGLFYSTFFMYLLPLLLLLLLLLLFLL